MVVDGLSKSLPSGASVLEVADYFALFGIDADDRQAALGELGVLLGDVLKLLVGVWAEACRDALVVDAQPVVEILEDAGDGRGTGLDVEGGEFCCDLLGGAAGPADLSTEIQTPKLTRIRWSNRILPPLELRVHHRSRKYHLIW